MSTVESAFILIDRASPPIRKIRRELRGLQRDAEAAGLAMDHLSGPRQVTQMEQLARETAVLRDQEHRLGQTTNQTERDMVRLERQHRRTRTETNLLTGAFKSLGVAMKLLKWPVLIAGAGGAVQVLAGLGAGAVALVPKLVDGAGAVAALGTTMVGLGAAVGVVKLATKDLSEAYGGNEKALKRLTPEGRAFLQMLRDMKPEIQQLRREAQKGIFPGAGDLLGDLRRQRGAIRQIVRQTSGDVGGLASFAGDQISKPGFMRDLVQLSDQGGRALGAAARSGFYFAHAIEEILLAGGPFTDWLGNTLERWTKTAAETAKVKRETGELGRSFDRTKDSLETLIDVGDHVFHALGGLMDGARGEGDSLWDSIDRNARRWDEWSNSFKGQTEMRRWFSEVRPVLSETADLVGDIGKEIAHLASGPEGARMLDALHKALPDVAQGVGDLTANLGPAAIDAIASGVTLLGDLGAASGPLTLVARAVGTVARTIDHLVNSLGPLGPAVGQLGVAALILRRAGLLGGRGGGGAGAGAAMVPMMLPGGGGGGGGAGAAVLGAGAGASVGRLARMRAGAGTGVANTRVLYAVGRELGAGRLGALGGALGGAGAGAMASTGMAAAGRVFWPLLLASGAMGALGTEGNALAKAQGGASALSLGVVPKPISDSQRQTAAGKFAGGVIDDLSTNGSLSGQRRSIAGLRQTIGMLPGNDALNQNEADLHAATKMLRSELRRREQLLKESEQAHRDSLNAQSIRHATAMADDFANAFDVRAKGPAGPAGAMQRTVDAVLAKQRKLKPAGAKVLDETMLAWAAAQARANPKLQGEYDRLARGIERDFSRMGKHVEVVNGQVLTGTRREWKGIRVALTTETEKARQEASDDFTAIQQQAVGSLSAMGFSPAEARKLVQGMEAGGQGGNLARSVVRAPRSNARNRLSGIPAQAAMGDGIGDAIGATRSIPARLGAGPGNLMGADADLGPYAAIGAKHGGHVSSGLRPGAITSSGNPSYHGSGDAIDIAGGDMMATAREIAAVAGPSLEELIFSPLGWGIKNGRRVPISYFGQQVIADHYDHVHVADTDPRGGGGLSAMVSMDTAGPGMRRVSLHGRASRLGGLPGMISTASSSMYAAGLEEKLNQALMGGAAFGGDGGSAAALRARFGLPAIFDAIRGAESGNDPHAHNPSGASGLYQIMMPLHAGLVARLAAQLGRPNDVYDEVVNTAAAAELFHQSGTSPWVSSKGTWGARGDGPGIARATVASAPVRMPAGAARGRGGGTQIHNHVSVSGGGGHSERRVVAIVDRRLQEFADAVQEDLDRGAEENEMELIA